MASDDDIQPGDWVCTQFTVTPSEVNYYTCTEIVKRYIVSIEDFIEMNPTLTRECDTIEPNTRYCVGGRSYGSNVRR